MRIRSLPILIAALFLIGSGRAQVIPGAQSSNELLKAAQKSKFEDVIKLVKSGMDPSMQDILGKNALMLILEAGHPDVAVSFIREIRAGLKADDRRSEPWREISPDWVFAVDRKTRALGGADSQGRTPLMIAAANGYTEVAKMLVSENVAVDASNSEGLTAAMIAEKAGHAEIAVIIKSKVR